MNERQSALKRGFVTCIECDEYPYKRCLREACEQINGEVMSDNEPSELASPCGVYCGACPSYIIRQSCYGCRPEDRSQKRISKWQCKIRQCCMEKKKIAFCYQCDEFPCKILVEFQKYGLGDKRLQHRAESIRNLEQIREIGIDSWLKQQEELWRCPRCGGRMVFYEFRCVDCDYRFEVV